MAADVTISIRRCFHHAYMLGMVDKKEYKHLCVLVSICSVRELAVLTTVLGALDEMLQEKESKHAW